MPKAIAIAEGWTSEELRRLAAETKHANQARRLLSLAAAKEGMNRAQAARIGGMDRQVLRDWVHRFNEHGPDGLIDNWAHGRPERLNAAQRAELSQLVTTGPDLAIHKVVRWRRADLQKVIADQFGIVYHERSVGKILKRLGFSHMSPRPKHPEQDMAAIAAFKKTSQPK